MKIHVQYKNKRFRRKPDIILADLIQNISSRQERPFLVTIGGPGGSGKSTFAKKLASRLKPHSIVLPLDDYKTPRALRSKLNVFGPHPRANEMELIKKHFQKVSRGKTLTDRSTIKNWGRSIQKNLFIPEKSPLSKEKWPHSNLFGLIPSLVYLSTQIGRLY